MQRKILDCTKLQCPMPVIKTKKELEAITEGILEVNVDNAAAKENLLKLAGSLNVGVEIEQSEGVYTITFIKKKQEDVHPSKKEEFVLDQTKKEMIMITGEFLGSGDDELGAILMKGFIYTLSETKPYPGAIMLINSAVKLATENEQTKQNLLRLEENGVKIMSCGTCLDFYKLKDKLEVGVISNMYDIVEMLKTTSNKMVI